MRRVLLLLLLAGCSNAGPTTTTERSTTASTVPASVVTTEVTVAGPSSTEAPPPSETIAGAGTGTLAYLGCSMTQDAVAGYHALGGTRFWPFYPQGGGTVDRWSDPTDQRWTRFERLLAENDADAVWLQICTASSRDASYEMVEAMVTGVRDRVGDVPLFIGWQPEYTASCGDNTAPLASREFAMAAIAAGLGAPDASPLGPLTEVDVQDDCVHANEAGQAKQGAQLLAFFG